MRLYIADQRLSPVSEHIGERILNTIEARKETGLPTIDSDGFDVYFYYYLTKRYSNPPFLVYLPLKENRPMLFVGIVNLVPSNVLERIKIQGRDLFDLTKTRNYSLSHMKFDTCIEDIIKQIGHFFDYPEEFQEYDANNLRQYVEKREKKERIDKSLRMVDRWIFLKNIIDNNIEIILEGIKSLENGGVIVGYGDFYGILHHELDHLSFYGSRMYIRDRQIINELNTEFEEKSSQKKILDLDNILSRIYKQKMKNDAIIEPHAMFAQTYFSHRKLPEQTKESIYKRYREFYLRKNYTANIAQQLAINYFCQRGEKLIFNGREVLVEMNPDLPAPGTWRWKQYFEKIGITGDANEQLSKEMQKLQAYFRRNARNAIDALHCAYTEDLTRIKAAHEEAATLQEYLSICRGR